MDGRLQQLTKNKVNVYPPELSLFQTPGLNASYTREQYVDYRPVSGSLNSGGPLDFVIAASPTQYISLKQSKLHIKVKLVNADGSPPLAEEQVAPINYPVQTLFAMVETLVSSTGGQHHP